MTEDERNAINEFMTLTRSLIIALWDVARPEYRVTRDPNRIAQDINRLSDIRQEFLAAVPTTTD